MRLLDARDGELVLVRQRPAAFSYYPTYQGSRREGMQSTLFASDPWHLMRRRSERLGNEKARRQALAFLEQGLDFYEAAENADVNAAKPLLLYYSFLNLAKCFVVNRQGSALGVVLHGLSERLPTTAGATHGHVSVDINKSPEKSAFVMFANALNASLPQPTSPSTSVLVRSQDFLSQILIGHRIFCQAENFTERFVSLDTIEYIHDPDNKEAWLRVRAYADDFSRLGYPLTSLSKCLSDRLTWRNVNCSVEKYERRIIEAETTSTISYSHRPSQVIGNLSQQASSRMWRSVTAYPPYRKYYIFKPAKTQLLFHQLLSLYLATYYFGSITRYKPESFELILNSALGPFVLEFFENQPSQFAYLLASELVGQEVARAAII